MGMSERVCEGGWVTWSGTFLAVGQFLGSVAIGR